MLLQIKKVEFEKQLGKYKLSDNKKSIESGNIAVKETNQRNWKGIMRRIKVNYATLYK